MFKLTKDSCQDDMDLALRQVVADAHALAAGERHEVLVPGAYGHVWVFITYYPPRGVEFVGFGKQGRVTVHCP